MDLCRETAPHHGDGLPLALLVGLAAPDRDAEAVLGLFEVRHVQRDELRRAEGAGEAEQQGRATAGALQGVGVACAIALAVSARMDALRTLAAPIERRIPR